LSTYITFIAFDLVRSYLDWSYAFGITYKLIYFDDSSFTDGFPIDLVVIATLVEVIGLVTLVGIFLTQSLVVVIARRFPTGVVLALLLRIFYAWTESYQLPRIRGFVL